MSTIGIVGGGQLGRMLTDAAHKLGFKVEVLDPTPGGPAAQIADAQIVGDFKDSSAIRKLAAHVDFLTFEIELADASTLEELARTGVKISPSPATLALIRDKLAQKEFLRRERIPVADFAPIESPADVRRAAEQFGWPLLLKARRDSYDGRGNALLRSESDIEGGFEKLAGRQLYVERFVPFAKELSVVAVRGMQGEVATYPVVETIHRNNICHEVLAPAPIPEAARARAEELAARTLEHLGGAGVFGLEMFFVPAAGDGGPVVLVNEIAPRVHNSGHHTTEACATSQFENHIRAVAGMPLGDTALVVPAAVMVNILGDRSGPAAPAGLEEAERIPGVTVHIYGKSETRPERKMGHVTATGATLEEAKEKAERARALISI